jgi:hypothetical protein
VRLIRKWIDANLIATGFWLLAIGLVLTILSSVRSEFQVTYVAIGAEGTSLSPLGLTLSILSELAGPVVYSSVLLIGVGMLLRSWRMTLVGFEHSSPGELVVSKPDENYVVWVGKRYQSALDAELAAKALAHRLKRVDGA